MRFGGIFLAATLLLGACSGDPEPKEPSPSATSQPTSTATPPAMPDQAKEDSPEGAAAFVTYWVQVLNHASVTGDVRALSQASSSGCSGCEKYIKKIESVYAAGGYFKGGNWELGRQHVTGYSDEVRIAVELKIERGLFREAKGVDEEVSRAESVEVGFSLPAHAPWTVDQFFLQGESN